MSDNQTMQIKDLLIQGSRNEPGIRCTVQTRQFMIEGTCRPENAREYFQPVSDWINEYIAFCTQNAANKLPFRFTFRLEYLNSISIKIIYDLLRKLERTENENIVIEWFYLRDDIDMKEVGEEYSRLLKLRFSMLEEPV